MVTLRSHCSIVRIQCNVWSRRRGGAVSCWEDRRPYFLRALSKRARTLRCPPRPSLIAASPSEPPAISLEAMQSATSAGDLEPSSKAVRHKAPMHRICTLFGRRQ